VRFEKTGSQSGKGKLYLHSKAHKNGFTQVMGRGKPVAIDPLDPTKGEAMGVKQKATVEGGKLRQLLNPFEA
jgi:hypothetical protein